MSEPKHESLTSASNVANASSRNVLWAFGGTLLVAFGLGALLFWPHAKLGNAPSQPKERPKLLDQPYRHGHPPPSNH